MSYGTFGDRRKRHTNGKSLMSQLPPTIDYDEQEQDTDCTWSGEFVARDAIHGRSSVVEIVKSCVQALLQPLDGGL